MEKEMREEMKREKKKAFNEGKRKGMPRPKRMWLIRWKNLRRFSSSSSMLGYGRALDDAGVAANDARSAMIEVPPLVDSEPTAGD
ncbi:hypothetical protein RHSIM_Rhsim12G0183800 [Rhododendron simsii]|uniref:Uncharacterized protein n=1 Tax=Rhododendron simsii TaxID=118357 RepID=A0A834G4V1_RHOSS|nr:hypothetical protein RHSIM_Rhsim12G0183800 [Rhododendron simsii]